jgi:hypothetical protein
LLDALQWRDPTCSDYLQLKGCEFLEQNVAKVMREGALLSGENISDDAFDREVLAVAAQSSKLNSNSKNAMSAFVPPLR